MVVRVALTTRNLPLKGLRVPVTHGQKPLTLSLSQRERGEEAKAKNVV
jgi:hypothetical protein